jgi:hypothetical protein
LKNVFRACSTLLHLVKDPRYNTSYYPDAIQKSKSRIAVELIMWLLKHREINKFYYVYGLDVENGGRKKDILPYKTFRALRDKKNLHPAGKNFNYASLLRDKFIFGQLLASLQVPTPKNIALLDREKITWLDTMHTMPLADLKNIKTVINGFCKQHTGLMGEGAFPLMISRGKFYSRNRELSMSAFRQIVDGEYLLQELIQQHPVMVRLHDASVNTMRVVTFHNRGCVDVFCATQRIGTNRKNVDNWASGGIVVSIDISTGRLGKFGFFKPGYSGGRVEVHPDSGVRFNGYELPYFQESLEMVSQLHRHLYGIHSIGWDIAVTPDGPVIIEGNDDWDGAIPMTVETDFKKRFLEKFIS